MKTNLNRLHAVWWGKVRGRGCGKTTLAIHHLLGCAMVSDGAPVFALIPEARHLTFIRPMLRGIAAEYGIDIGNVVANQWPLHVPLVLPDELTGEIRLVDLYVFTRANFPLRGYPQPFNDPITELVG
jgi:hypothetical protein